MTDLDPAAVMAEHRPTASGMGRRNPDAPDHCPACSKMAQEWVNATAARPCLPYRLAEALAAETFRTAKFDSILKQYEEGRISKVACVSLMLNV